MSRGVQPKNVSPLIRGARYSFLIAGWFYGKSKKALYTKIEGFEKPKREAFCREENKQKLKVLKEKNINELKKIFEEIDFEPEPGWEGSI